MAGLNKVVSSYEEALAGLSDDMTIMVGGFGLCGIPEGLINQMVKMGVKGLTAISNNAGVDDFGLGLLLKHRQISTMIASYVGENATFEQQMLSGELNVILTPQGTLAEKSARAVPVFRRFSPPQATVPPWRKAKKPSEIKGRHYVLEESLTADFALVRAWKADTMGNLVFRKTAANFNPMMATAGKITVVEAEFIVEPGELDPDHIHTPGIYVDRVIQGKFEKRIEQRTVKAAK
ncbi:CoA transferase subunit A [Shewanella seohaensis]|uniref:CoA transferase subunit A n=1 Tax=Shewanella seohaensis TaxID=755175 RepID=UPI0021C684C4|nr:CoA transferase subunit A [Shewanella seohaensis]UXM81124.1 CoA transferase subunit A [Shewanella seohaensis]